MLKKLSFVDSDSSGIERFSGSGEGVAVDSGSFRFHVRLLFNFIR